MVPMCCRACADTMPVAPFFNGTVVDVADGLEKILTETRK